MSDDRWALLWRSTGGQHLLRGGDCNVMLFRTRQQARDHRDEKYGYIRDRPDLRRAPHGWKLPKVLRVTVRYDHE